jgi:hypothetical protein
MCVAGAVQAAAGDIVCLPIRADVDVLRGKTQKLSG